MKHTMIAIISLMLIGCGKPLNESPAETGVHVEFAPYVAEYERYKGSPISAEISIQFSNSLRSNVAGQCDHLNHDIVISASDWRYMSEERKLVLIMHELGHCDLGIRGHDDSIDSRGRPASLMNTYNIYVSFQDIPKFAMDLFSKKQ